ncbi:hypothetical protein RAS1_15220 [Phycisphaerae bacterium RAS1]|nr:hypothetical protein RAS1_15220 [Phycisphaerae bacterium RAS1]
MNSRPRVTSRFPVFSTAALIIALSHTRPASADPPCERQWGEGFARPGVSDSVHALTVFDDGSGPALYVGGVFATAGGMPVNYIGKWTGSTWSPLGNGMNFGGAVTALTVFDDGSGPALYAGGHFTTAWRRGGELHRQMERRRLVASG